MSTFMSFTCPSRGDSKSPREGDEKIFLISQGLGIRFNLIQHFVKVF